MFFTCCAIILAYYHRQRARQTGRRSWIALGLATLLLLALATLGGYSRIYLSQHFLSDVCVGSIIGFVTPFLVFGIFGDRLLKLNNERGVTT